MRIITKHGGKVTNLFNNQRNKNYFSTLETGPSDPTKFGKIQNLVIMAIQKLIIANVSQDREKLAFYIC